MSVFHTGDDSDKTNNSGQMGMKFLFVLVCWFFGGEGGEKEKRNTLQITSKIYFNLKVFYFLWGAEDCFQKNFVLKFIQIYSFLVFFLMWKYSVSKLLP